MGGYEFWLVLLSGVAAGMVLIMSARWVGTKLWRERGRAMLVICAWCSNEIRRNSIHGELVVSHGICLKCRQEHFPKTKVEISKKEVVTIGKDRLKVKKLSLKGGE